MLALGEEHGGKIWSLLDDDELRELSDRHVDARHHRGGRRSRACCSSSSAGMSASGALMGNYDATERLLQQFLPPERVGGIMEEIRGPAGRNMWEKLANVHEEVLANYLKNEYPQTVAVVLSKIRPEHAARVLGDPARGARARRRQPHAADGGGAEGDARAGRADAAHRVHVEPRRRPAAATRTR